MRFPFISLMTTLVVSRELGISHYIGVPKPISHLEQKLLRVETKQKQFLGSGIESRSNAAVSKLKSTIAVARKNRLTRKELVDKIRKVGTQRKGFEEQATAETIGGTAGMEGSVRESVGAGDKGGDSGIMDNMSTMGQPVEILHDFGKVIDRKIHLSDRIPLLSDFVDYKTVINNFVRNQATRSITSDKSPTGNGIGKAEEYLKSTFTQLGYRVSTQTFDCGAGEKACMNIIADLPVAANDADKLTSLDAVSDARVLASLDSKKTSSIDSDSSKSWTNPSDSIQSLESGLLSMEEKVKNMTIMGVASNSTKIATNGLKPIQSVFSFLESKDQSEVDTLSKDDTIHNGVMLVSAHYDSIPQSGGIAPGAEDNGSGVAGLISIGKYLKAVLDKYGKKSFTRPVKLVAFSAEESGTEGSEAFVKKFIKEAPTPLNVFEVLVMDEIAFKRIDRSDGQSFGETENPPAASERAIFETVGQYGPQTQLIDALGAAAQQQEVQLAALNGDGASLVQSDKKKDDDQKALKTKKDASEKASDKKGQKKQMDLQVNFDGFGSDHIPFLSNGIPAVLLIEGDNLWYQDHFGHTVNDTLNHIDYDFGSRMAGLAGKAVLGLLLTQKTSS